MKNNSDAAGVRLAIGQSIQRHISEVGLNKYAICAEAGISMPTLDGVLRGRNFSIDTLSSVLRACGMGLVVAREDLVKRVKSDLRKAAA
jgi:predicted transcriptional regulator